MPFTPQTYQDKPYNRCVICERLGVYCDGPNFYTMTMERLGEWCRLRKNHLNTLEPGKWTNKYIADEAGVSLKSVERLMSGKAGDMSIYTVSQILRVLVNGTWGQYPCPLSVVSEAEQEALDNAKATAADCKRLTESLARVEAETQRKVAFLTKQIEEKDKQIASKDERLAERRDFIYRKDRIIGILSVLLALCLVVIIGALFIDATNPDVGFLWLDRLAATFNNGIGALGKTMKGSTLL